MKSTVKNNGPSNKSGETLASTVYERLRNDVLTGHLKPGEKLRTEFLRDRYQIGNSPIREALNRLSADGLVEREDQKGFRVASVTRGDLLELVKTRCLLEEVAIRESIRSGGASWEEGVVLSFHRLSRFPRPPGNAAYTLDAEWERLHGDFHMAMVSGCGSQRLIAYCEELFDKSERYRRLAAPGVSARNELEEHRGLMEACIEGDIDQVVRLLHDHYGRTVDIILASGSEFLAEEADQESGQEPATA